MAHPASLDTNCLLRWVLMDIPAQSEAVTRALARQQEFEVADMAVSEFVFVLEKVYGLPRHIIANNVKAIATHPHINCNRVLLDRVLPTYVQFPSLSFADCCLTVYAELNGATPLLTFDQALAKKLQHAELLTA